MVQTPVQTAEELEREEFYNELVFGEILCQLVDLELFRLFWYYFTI